MMRGAIDECSNPNNPTGALLSDKELKEVIALAKEHDIFVFSDEVFSPLFFTEDHPSPIVSLGYEKAVSSGSLSKAYGLPGLRLGWIVTRDAALRKAIIKARDFTTISVSRLDDGVATYALSDAVRPYLLKRNIALCQESLNLLQAWLDKNEKRVRWKRPVSTGTAFVQILGEDGKPVDDAVFTGKVADEGGVTVIPGGVAFGDQGEGDFRGYLRITLGEPGRLPEGLKVLERFIYEK